MQSGKCSKYLCYGHSRWSDGEMQYLISEASGRLQQSVQVKGIVHENPQVS